MMKPDILMKALISALYRKQMLQDSFVVEESGVHFNEDGIGMRTVMFSFTEVLQKSDYEFANKNNGRFPNFYGQIRKEYDRLEKEQ